MFAQYMLKLAALVVGEPSRFRMESSDIETLRAKLIELNEDARTIQNHADAESRALTEDEDRQLAAIFNEFERVEKDLQRRQKMIDNEAYCMDILTQSLAIQKSLASLNKLVLENHITTHITDMLSSGEPKEQQKALEELLNLYELNNIRGK